MEKEVTARSIFLAGFGHEYKVGSIVPVSAIYECSECDNIKAFKHGEKFLECHDCKHHIRGQRWYHTNDTVHFASKNLNKEFDRMETLSLKISELIADFAGNIWFVYFHVLWFSTWIYMNTGHPIFGIVNFDPYPFHFLTLVVSLEAIFLATFILIAQNIQGKKSELRGELDYQTNLKVEKGVAEAMSILGDIREGKLALTKSGEIVFLDGKSNSSGKSKKRGKH